ncbi:MAG TPA: peptide chain release factor N(5)-glutamine methyltransferase, partial [bacterium]|nr:peptide chain release factor N(5)-glutamine methyltransferase [bacterium]
LELAQYNADRHRVGSRLRFCQGDLWPPAGSFQMVVSNPPYIPSLKLKGLRPEVRTEPIQALDGGRDGLTYYRRIAVGLHQYLSSPGWVLLEVGARQAEEVGELMAAVGLTVLPPVCDLAGTPRLVQGYFK